MQRGLWPACGKDGRGRGRATHATGDSAPARMIARRTGAPAPL